MRPSLLDLFCGAGGCSMGYHRAGFDVIGVDHKPQKNYPFEFVQMDALDYLKKHGHKFDVIHASPPCQRYSKATHGAGTAMNHPDLVEPVRLVLQQIGKPFVIENVPGAPLIEPLKLSGMMFDLDTIRERWFETVPAIWFTPVPVRKHANTAKQGTQPIVGEQYISVVGHFSNVAYARRAMGIEWMTRDELAQAIPPVYTEYIGRWMQKLVFGQSLDVMNLGELVS